MFEILIITTVLIALTIASITDIKTREVPDWLNFSLVPIGLFVRLVWSILTNDYSFIMYGVFGFLVFFVLGLIMFYTGQWGGGDSKMLISLGTLIGLEFNFESTLISFLVNLVIVGSIYGLIWSIILSIKNRTKFIKEFRKTTKSMKRYRIVMIITFIVLFLIVLLIPNIFTRFLLISFIVVIYSSFYLILFVKVVEKSCMLKYVKPNQLTEGDWIAKDIIISKKYIAGPKDLGIEKKQIKKLISLYKQGKVKNILIKIGIPFVPSFLFAYILTLIFNNLFLYILT
jgi:Flp pilus assembly protein protease CpaA